MKVDLDVENDYIVFTFSPDENDDLEPVAHYKMVHNVMKIKPPVGCSLDSIHPDHLALIAMLAVHPFTKGELVFPNPISKRFFDATKIISKYTCSPVDESIEPYYAIGDSFPGLAYSGGADSSAALAVMPGHTKPLFMERPDRKNSLYDKTAALKSCSKLKALGYDVFTIECDVEYLRHPIGFPTDLANAIPAILMAGHLNLDSISYGTVLESSYGAGHDKYRDYPTLSHWRLWSRVFTGAGIPMSLPVGGVSEVGTKLILDKSFFEYLSQSCIRGKWKKPCLNCWKCFRKELLTFGMEGVYDDNKIENLFRIKEARIFLSQIPIKHENVIAYSVQRIESDCPTFLALKKRVIGEDVDLSWLEKWFPESIMLNLEIYQNHISSKLNEYLGPMNQSEIKALKDWNKTIFLNEQRTLDSNKELVQLFE